MFDIFSYIICKYLLLFSRLSFWFVDDWDWRGRQQG